MTRLPAGDHTFFLQAAGHRLCARAIIPADMNWQDKPVLVFLHEGLGCIDIWRDFPHLLVNATGLPALIYDRYGSGGSEPFQEVRNGVPFRWEAEAALPDVLSSCGIDRPILIGHSDGGSIALQYASSFPESPRAVVSMAAHVFAEELTLSSIRAAVAAFNTGNLRDRLARYHGGQTESMFRGWSDVWLKPENQGWNMEAALPAIRCPLLIVQGKSDEYGTMAQVHAIAAGVSGSTETLILPDCAHSPHFQAQQATLAGLTAFILNVINHE